MPIIDLPSGHVHYAESGQGLPLILLHANPGDHLDYNAVIPTLAQHYRVLALDWPGYGRSALSSSPSTIGPDFFYSILREFLAALQMPPALFIGNSLGGNMAARLAIDAPESVRGMVLVSPSGFTPQNAVTRSFCRFQGSRFAMSPRFFAGLYLKRRTATSQAMLERAATSQATAERVALNRAAWRGFSAPEYDLRSRANQIKSPTLLVFGKQDPVVPPKRDGVVAARRIPAARLVAMPCGHCAFAEVPELSDADLAVSCALCRRRRMQLGIRGRIDEKSIFRSFVICSADSSLGHAEPSFVSNGWLCR